MHGTKAKILDAASALFLEGGAAALSVRAIARKAGMSTIGIYSHFQGKQGILEALYIEGFEKVSAAMQAGLEGLSPREAVLQAARNYLANATENAAHYRLIFGEVEADFTPSEAAYAAGAEAFGYVTELVGALLPAEASLRDKQQAALEIWSITHGYVSLQHHAVARLMAITDWEPLVLRAVETHLDAMIAAYKR
jgi:AcrR family transcriptional regulator